jgi:hypothetical protein
MFIQNFSSPASKQTDLEFFFYIFSRKFQKISEELISEFQNNPNLSKLFHATTSKACSCKSSTLASTQTDKAKFWIFFQENFRIFQKILE